MKRTMLALFLSPWLVGAAYAQEDELPPAMLAQTAPTPPSHAPPSPPHSPLPPLPPLPPMTNGPAGSSTATLDVKGAVTLRADVLSSDIEVVVGAGKQVKAQLIDSTGAIRLSQSGDRVEVGLSSKGGWPHVPAGIDGKLRIEVPSGSHVELTSASGDIVVRDTWGNVRVRTASGEVHLRKVSGVEVMAVSGDVVVDNASGEVRLRTVSGDAQVSQAGGKLEYGTTSGDLDWSGSCRAGCRIEARSTSGDIKLRMTPDASFDLRYVTHSGDVSDDLKMQTLEQSESHHGGGSLHARFGKGEGLIEAQTFSGDLHVTRR
jgi:putative adhesin